MACSIDASTDNPSDSHELFHHQPKSSAILNQNTTVSNYTGWLFPTRYFPIWNDVRKKSHNKFTARKKSPRASVFHGVTVPCFLKYNACFGQIPILMSTPPRCFHLGTPQKSTWELEWRQAGWAVEKANGWWGRVLRRFHQDTIWRFP